MKLRRLADKLGVKWKRNALRHSFVSYRMAAVQNAAQVALEAGNSPRVIFTNYRELVTARAARQWFGIVVTIGDKIRLKKAQKASTHPDGPICSKPISTQ